MQIDTLEQFVDRAVIPRLTQTVFVERIDTPVATLRDWEQGLFAPPVGVLCLLHLNVKHPELSRELA
jgi:putative transcriptional regulator